MYCAHLLGNGKGIVLEVPVLPNFAYKKYEKMSFHDGCDCTTTKIAEILMKIKKDKRNKSQYLLLLFPDRIVCSGDLFVGGGTERNKLAGGELQIRFGLIGDKAKLGLETFDNKARLAAKWVVRIDEQNPCSLDDNSEDEDTKWNHAFKGMRIHDMST